jgi:uncharacterized protein (TIGR02996 family)
VRREQDLLAAIAAAPDDDAPRLVYADWLTEHGDLKGEWISLHVQHARAWPGSRRWHELGAQLKARPSPWKWDGLLNRVEIVRGFPEKATFRFDELDAAAASVFEELPLLRDVTFFDVLDTERAQLLVSRPWFKRITSLTRSGHTVDELSVILAGAPHLRRLGVSHPTLPPRIYYDMANHGGLISVELDGTETGDWELTQLVIWRKLKLERLQIRKGRIGQQGCLLLSDEKTIRSLSLVRQGIDWRGVDKLARLEGLVELDLTRCDVGERGCAALARSRMRPRLVRLHRGRLTAAAASLLAVSPFLDKVELLDVRNNDLDEGALAPLRERLGEGLLDE